MRFPIEGHRYLGFFPPYRRLEPLDHPYQIPRSPLPNRGSVLIWNLNPGEISSSSRSVRARPPGVALFVVLPPTRRLGGKEALFRLMSSCRPHSILPHVEEVDPEELVMILRRRPTQFSVEVAEYLSWRGMELDLDTRRLIRKTLDLSLDLRTVSGLARALYMSRRALGRRFMTRGLPVPSHWLHFSRILRGSIKLQDPKSTLFSVGCELGYPDGFAFSNQMKRLTGLRPSIMRECFGWEWIVESWLHREAEKGNLAANLRNRLYPTPWPEEEGASVAAGGSNSIPAPRIMRVAEDLAGNDS
jgi:AraC-like DNA-binding protein